MNIIFNCNLICICMYLDAVTGKYSKNPFDFKNNKLSKFTISVNNIPLEYRSLNLDFDNRYLLAFQGLLDGLNLGEKTIGITRNSFLDGNCLFAFQLQSFESEQSFYPTQGTLKLELTFSAALKAPITAIILSQTINLMTIDRFRDVNIENQGILQ